MTDRHHLKAEHICKTYSSRQVVCDVSIELQSGEVVGLLGPNGAGKTTSFYMMVGLTKPDQGKVYINNTDITNLPMYKRALAGISYLPQEASIFRRLTVTDNLMAILELTDLSKNEQHNRCQELLEEFRITHIASSFGYALSGGERRRVEIARALVLNPHFILLDEPFAGIDPIAVLDIQEIIVELKKSGRGILISDHNVRETLGVCDSAYILSEGSVLESGSPEQIASSERVRKTYLGENFSL